MSPTHPDYLAGGTWIRPSLLSQNSEMNANRPGFLAGLQKWAETVKARPPPSGRRRVGGEHRRGR